MVNNNEASDAIVDPHNAFKWFYCRDTYNSEKIIRQDLETGIKVVVLERVEGGRGRDVAMALMHAYHIGVSRGQGTFHDFESFGVEDS